MLRVNDSFNAADFISQQNNNENEISSNSLSSNSSSTNSTASQQPSNQEQNSSQNDISLPNFKTQEQQLLTNMFRQSLQSKASSTTPPTKEEQKILSDESKNQSNSNINAPFGAVVGEKAATRQSQTANEIYNYPQRSEQSDKAASVMESAMKDASLPKAIGRAIGAGVSENGIIVLSPSGPLKDVTSEKYFELLSTGKLQEKLNNAFINDSTIKKNTDNVTIDVKLGKINSKDLETKEYSKPATEAFKQAMKDANLPQAKIEQLEKFVVAGVKDGKVVIGSTNNANKLSPGEYYEVLSKGKLQEKLNTVFANDTNVPKTTNVAFELGPTKIKNLDIKRTITYPDFKIEMKDLKRDIQAIQPDTPNLKEIVIKNPIESVKTLYKNTSLFPTYHKEDRVCAEERLFQANGVEKLNSMSVIARTDLPKGAKPNKNEYVERLNNPTEKVMVPCVSCKENSEVIINSNTNDVGLRKFILNNELNEASKSAAGAGLVAGATYLLDQQINNKPVDGKALVGNTLLGSGTGVIGGKIEQTISKKFLLPPNATFTAGQTLLRQSVSAAGAGAILGAGITGVREFSDYQAGKISGEKYAKDTLKEGTIGGLAGAGGAAAGAYFGGIVGSAVPIAGTIVGIAAGAVTGYIIDKTAHAILDEQTIEKVTIPLSAFEEGVRLKVPVYPSDTQFDVMIRSYKMTAKSIGLPQQEVDQVGQKWSATYHSQSNEIRFTQTVNGQKQVISDEGFQQYKQQGSILVDIRASTHGTILQDIQHRLENTLPK